MSINKCFLVGNITFEPELRQTATGTSVLAFGIAVNERVKRGDNWEDKPNFFDCTIFGKRADALASFLSKGMKVSIDGRLSYSQWEQDGKKRSKVEIIVDNLELPSKNNSTNAQATVECGEEIPF